MYYSVQVKRDLFAADHDYTFVESYFQGCERDYMTEEEARSYFNSFEDWEQDLLIVEAFPF